MKSTRMILYTALVTTSVVFAGSSLLEQGQGQNPGNPPPIPSDTHAFEVELVAAQRFTVGEKITHVWRNDGLKYDTGWLLVLKAAPGLITHRQSFEPVLYVGAQTANRVQSSWRSGHVVAIVPGDFLLTDTPIFFGAPALPEELGQTDLDTALRRAVADGVKPPAMADVAAAVNPELLRVADHYALRQKAVDLVAKYSPQETDFIRGERVPLIR